MATIPSPYEVSFILIVIAGTSCSRDNVNAFPSPYGVLFILMNSNFLFQDLRFGNVLPSAY